MELFREKTLTKDSTLIKEIQMDTYRFKVKTRITKIEDFIYRSIICIYFKVIYIVNIFHARHTIFDIIIGQDCLLFHFYITFNFVD